MTTFELVAATALFGWECPPAWQRISRIAKHIAVDPFFDLFAMSCIVANTVLMALDHSDIDNQMSLALHIGNNVCIMTSTVKLLLGLMQSNGTPDLQCVRGKGTPAYTFL